MVTESSSIAFELLMDSLCHPVLTDHLSIKRELLQETPPPTGAEEDKKAVNSKLAAARTSARGRMRNISMLVSDLSAAASFAFASLNYSFTEVPLITNMDKSMPHDCLHLWHLFVEAFSERELDSFFKAISGYSFPGDTELPVKGLPLYWLSSPQ